MPDEANDMAQSSYRYRLIMFSNFLTTVGAVTTFEPNLVDILHDTHPGSVVVVLGGKGKSYSQVYEYVDRLAKPAGFHLKIAGDEVSSADTVVADRVYEEGLRFYERLRSLALNEDDQTRKVRLHFEGSRKVARSSFQTTRVSTAPRKIACCNCSKPGQASVAPLSTSSYHVTASRLI